MEADHEEELSKESFHDKAATFSNYMDNTVIRLPFDPEFPITTDLLRDLCPGLADSRLQELLGTDLLALHTRLCADKIKWLREV